MTWRQTIIDFLNKKSSKAASCTSSGYKLYSYNTCIAEWKSDILIINRTKYSTTTSKHQNYLLAVNNNEILEVCNIPFGSNKLNIDLIYLIF